MHTARRAALEKRRQQNQKRSLTFTLGGAVLLVAGGTLAFLLLRGRQPGVESIFGVNVTPQNVLLSFTTSTDSDPWRQLEELGTSELQKSWKDRLSAFEADFLTPFKLTYEKDIRPWLGSQATLTLLSPAPEDVAQVGANATVWLLPIRDPQRAKAVLNQITPPPVARTYKDVVIQVFKGEGGKTLSTAVIEDKLLVVSNGDITLNQVIDTYRGGPSLAQTPRFQEALGTIQDNSAFGHLYINLPIATAGILQNAGRNFSASNLERLQAIQGLGATISIAGDGLKLNSISWLKPDAKAKLKTLNAPQSLARLLPEDTVLMTAGASFQQAWQDYSTGTEAQLVVPFNPRKIQSDVQKSTGMDFEKEFVSWMSGEFVAAVVPTADQEKQGVGLLLLAKARDRTQAEASFQKLDAAMRDRYSFLVAKSKVNNRTVTTWKVPPNLPLASHGWLDDNVAFFTFGGAIADRVTGAVSASLPSTTLFRATTQTSLNPNDGKFFADLTRTTALMQNSPLLPKLSPDALKFTQGIEGIGITSAVQNEWSTRYDMVVKLKR